MIGIYSLLNVDCFKWGKTRMLNNNDTFAHLTAKDIMTKNPKTIQLSSMVTDALNILEDFSITQLVVTEHGEYKGVLHLHDILKEGIV